MSDFSPIRKRQRVASPERDTYPSPQCARWCGPNDQWDETKIKCFLSEQELSDPESMRRLMNGTDIAFASRFHPLIFDQVPAGSSTVRLRSLPFLGALAFGEPGALREYKSLYDDDQKRLVGLAVRDLFLASMRGLLDEDEKQVLKKLVGVVDDTVGCTAFGGMTISFYPSASFKMVKFVDGLDSSSKQGILPYFAQVLETPKLHAVFVDPCELSYHNFENIVPLDSWIEAQTAALTTKLGEVAEVEPGVDVWTAKLQGPDTELIKRLSSLELYAAPLNKATRGGKRFIFHSAHLSKALTSAVIESGLITRLAGGKFENSDFAFVNYVFRCNHFTLGDSKFATHRDTPYYDAMRQQVSRYTLLLYLSSGKNDDGVLSINNNTTRFNEIDAFTCIVFDQRHEHQGYPFTATDKVFLRTELVFNDADISRGHSQIASLFSEACYMIGQSVFDQELEANAHESFERANSLHWAIESTASTKPPVYLYKQYRGFRFLTNGYNYWFAQSKTENNLVDCAMLAVLDYFNVKLGGSPFRSMCRSTTVRETITSTAEAFRIMSSREATPQEESDEPSSFLLRRLTDDVLDGLFKPSPDKPFTPRPKPSWEEDDEGDEEDEDGEDANKACCPFHTWTTFNAWDSKEVEQEHRQCRKHTRNRLFGVPLLFLGQDLVINEKLVRVVGDKILFLTPDDDKKEMPRFNFAACWGDGGIGPEVFVDVDQEVPAPRLLIPPVVYHEYPGLGYHFVVDFFRNDWMIKVDDEHKIPVPVITNDVPEEWEEEHVGGPFWQRVKSLAGSTEKDLEGTFWTRDSDEELSDEEE